MHTTLLALAVVATTTLASGSALAQTGGPAAGGPGSNAANDGPFETQSWGPHGRLETSRYAVERVTYQSDGTEVVGNLFTPAIPGRKPAVIIIGPVAFVKEQAAIQYASRLVREGYTTLIFDPRHHGESGGEPRRHESGVAKVEDLRASIDFLVAREAEARIRRSREAEAQFKATAEVSYIPVVAVQPTAPDPTALLTAPPIHQFYIRWVDRGPFWKFPRPAGEPDYHYVRGGDLEPRGPRGDGAPHHADPDDPC